MVIYYINSSHLHLFSVLGPLFCENIERILAYSLLL